MMASPHEEILQSEPKLNTSVMCGGLTEARALDDRDRALFEEFRDLIEEKVRAEFQIPEGFELQPVKVRSQVVAGVKYYFDVPLPNNQVAQVSVLRPVKGSVPDDRSKLVHVRPGATTN